MSEKLFITHNEDHSSLVKDKFTVLLKFINVVVHINSVSSHMITI
jgi:hypothetical protein